MSELQNLADATIDAERKKLIASIHALAETVKAKRSASGLAMSRGTLTELVNAFSQMLDSLRDVIITQYQWAISESLFSTQTFVEDLVGASRDHVAILYSACVDRARREASNIAAAKNAIPECDRKLSVKNEEVCVDIALALRAKFATLKRHRLRSIWYTATGWIGKIAGGPPRS